MDGTKALSKVFRGYALAARALGTPHAIHRPSGTSAPTTGTPLATIPAVFDANDLRFTRAQRRGQPTFTGLWEASLTQPGDYLVGADATWCVASQDALLPLTAYRCDRVISIARAGSPALGVSDAYGGEGQSMSDILTGYPCAMTARGGGEGGIGLPGDVSGGGATVLLPPVPDVLIRASDILADDLGRRWRIEGAELTPAGWRLHVSGAQT